MCKALLTTLCGVVKMDEILALMEKIIELFESADGVVATIGAAITAFTLAIEGIVSLIGVAGVIISAVVSFIVVFSVYLFRAIPIFALGRKVHCKQAWLVWIPFFQDIISTFVLFRISGKSEFQITKKNLSIKHGNFVLLGYAMFRCFGGTIVAILFALLNLIPGFGQVASLLSTLIYYFLVGIIDYVCLRDAIGRFKEDRKQNSSHSLIIVILDTFITFGWARTIYLMSMMKMKPLPEKPNFSYENGDFFYDQTKA